MLIQLFQPQTLSHRSVSVVVGNRRHGQIILTDDKLERSTHESCRQYLFIHSLCSETVSAYVAKSVSVLQRIQFLIVSNYIHSLCGLILT